MTPVNELSDTEREVAECIATGMSDQQILAERSITRRQLKHAITSLYLKSESQCARALVVWCQRATRRRNVSRILEVGPTNSGKGR